MSPSDKSQQLPSMINHSMGNEFEYCLCFWLMPPINDKRWGMLSWEWWLLCEARLCLSFHHLPVSPGAIRWSHLCIPNHCFKLSRHLDQLPVIHLRPRRLSKRFSRMKGSEIRRKLLEGIMVFMSRTTDGSTSLLTFHSSVIDHIQDQTINGQLRLGVMVPKLTPIKIPVCNYTWNMEFWDYL